MIEILASYRIFYIERQIILISRVGRRSCDDCGHGSPVAVSAVFAGHHPRGFMELLAEIALACETEGFTDLLNRRAAADQKVLCLFDA